MFVLLGLGGNQGNVLDSFEYAVAGLTRSDRVVARSALYRTTPVGPEQADFLNAALLIECRSDLGQLLDRCRTLETAVGRDRAAEERWGARPLDLDLLLAADIVHRGPRLVVPHPRLHERAFALVPAAELVPDWLYPGLGRTVSELAEEALRRDPSAVRIVTDESRWG
jgi:2-amino-4-hydroxy-6-hydroxymethyldihydropteridine diphosphokinase